MALKTAMDEGRQDKSIKIAYADFEAALDKVFPSVSKRDELLYARL